ncbi:protein phosphatase 2C domain-containing protein [Streptomyces sp. NPDC088116]|uniref:PP2C family protein-serine/threonine phosphatase n=1 Tax=Streptomyces sp. NPDC088116 TaxID=3365825 RepID=UPI0037FDD47F
MSQMPHPAARPVCPSCEEPLESGDLFCGACGHDLSAVPPPPGDHPTLVISNAPDGVPVAGTPWPTAAGTDGTGPAAATYSAEELLELESSGSRPPAHPEDYELPAPLAPVPGAPAGGVPAPDVPAPAAPVSSAAAGPGATGPVSASVPACVEAAGDPAGDPVDPRTADPALTAPPGSKVCVACRAGRVDRDGYCENCGHAQPRERDHMEQELGAVAAVSDRGLRHHRNEDAFAVSSAALPDGSPAVVAVVCDGVSSATRPDDASAAAASSANESLLGALERGTHPRQAMHDAIVVAADAVNSLAVSPPSALDRDAHRHQNAPACTIVGAVVASGLLTVGWVGDSRVYWVPDDRGGPPARLTEDDSWAAQMVAAGLMNEAQAYADERAHAITGWLGADAYELEPHTASFKPDRPGVVVVCTDGLWNYAEGADEMARALPADAAARPLHAAQVLVGHALDGGGHDNVTVAVLPFAVPPRGAGSAYNTA